MALSSMAQTLVSQATVGMGNQVLDLSVFPESLRSNIEQLQATCKDPEDAFLQSVALVVTNEQSNQSLEVNSFSIEQMELYGKIQSGEVTIEKPAKGSKATSAKGKGKSTKGAKAKDAAADAAASAADGAAADGAAKEKIDPAKLATQMRKHKGPMPIQFYGANLPPAHSLTFWHLFKHIPNNDYGNMVPYCVFEKMSHYPLRFYNVNSRFVHYLRMFFTPYSSDYNRLFSPIMLQEAILKCLAPNVYFLLPWIDPKFAKQLSKSILRSPLWDLNDPSRIDYMAIFEQVSGEDAAGIFVKLRHTNLEMSRQVAQQFFDKQDESTRLTMAQATFINLSIEDEPWLCAKVATEESEKVRLMLFKALCEIPGTQFGQRCGELVRQYLSYDPDANTWQLSEIDVDDPQFQALGIRVPAQVKHKHRSDDCMIKLLEATPWSVYCELAQSTDPEVVVQRWKDFKCNVALPLLHFSTNANKLTATSIYASRDVAAARAFVKLNTERRVSKSEWKAGWHLDEMKVLLLLDVPERIEALKAINAKQTIYACSDVLQLPEESIRHEPVDTNWLLALLGQNPDFPNYEHIALYPDFIYWLPISSLDWFKEQCALFMQKRDELGEQSTELTLKIEAMKKKRSLEVYYERMELEAKQSRIGERWTAYNRARAIFDNLYNSVAVNGSLPTMDDIRAAAKAEQ